MDRFIFDYSKLCGRIIEKCGTRKEFARVIRVSTASLSLKLNNKSYFSQDEIQRAIQVLDIESGSVSSYFFTLKL